MAAKKAVLGDYFARWADALLASARLTELHGVQDSRVDAAAREFFIDSFLSSTLPSTAQVSSGLVVDSSGVYSNNLDVVVTRGNLMRLPMQVVGSGTMRLHIIEAVAGVIYVTSRLSPAKLKQARADLASVHSLTLAGGPWVKTGTKPRPRLLVFAIHAEDINAIMEELKEPAYAKIFDAVCILDHGAFRPMRRGMPGFGYIDSAAAAVATLFEQLAIGMSALYSPAATFAPYIVGSYDDTSSQAGTDGTDDTEVKRTGDIASRSNEDPVARALWESALVLEESSYRKERLTAQSLFQIYCTKFPTAKRADEANMKYQQLQLELFPRDSPGPSRPPVSVSVASHSPATTGSSTPRDPATPNQSDVFD